MATAYNSDGSIELWKKRKPLETRTTLERQIGTFWKPIPTPSGNTVVQYLRPHVTANTDHTLMPQAINMFIVMVTDRH